MSEKSFIGVERRGFLRLLGVSGAASLGAGTLAGCGPASTSATHSDGAKNTIEAGISYTLSSGFDPSIASGATPVAANMHVFEALVDLEPASRKPYPALATELPKKIDDTTYRVSLRHGATFHNGDPVTANDVVFSFERILNPENDSLMLQFLPFLDKVRALNKKTVEFKLKYPFPLFSTRLCVTKIVPKKIVQHDPKAFDAKPIGSGPYELVEATKEDKIVLEKAQDYNGPKPAHVDRLTWRLVADPSARVSAMDSERLDAIEDVPYVDIKRLRSTSKVSSVQSFGMLFLMFNCAQEPFSDKRVRQALRFSQRNELRDSH